MRVIITTHCADTKQHVCQLLNNPLSGDGELLGSKHCVDQHLSLCNLIEYDLTFKEIEAVKKLKCVESVQIHFGEVGKDIDPPPPKRLGYKNVVPRLASFTTTFPLSGARPSTNIGQAVSHSLFYCQQRNMFGDTLRYGSADETSGMPMTLSSLDCSNIDMIIIDSGVDAAHEEFKVFEGGGTRVMTFPWNQLTEWNGFSGTHVPILTGDEQRFFNSDVDGHGTACASLAAGNRSGIAKNARIYSISSDDLPGGVAQACKLALAFQRAKNSNSMGLDSTRPTILSMSIGSIMYLTSRWGYSNTRLFGATLRGPGWGSYISRISIRGNTTLEDSYFSLLALEGVHCVVSAGNSNQFMHNNSSKFVDVHGFEGNDGSGYALLLTAQNKNKYVIGRTYNTDFSRTNKKKKKRKNKLQSNTPRVTLTQFKYLGVQRVYFKGYDTGLVNFDDSRVPTIRVGCVTNIGSRDSLTSGNDSGYEALTVYNALQKVSSATNLIVVNKNTKYKSHKGPFFVKTSYSNWGPSVDIYAPGNGTWVAHSVSANDAQLALVPSFSLGPNNVFRFFNGTSAATPIAAGCLATWLTVKPSLPPLSAKQLLLTTSLTGAIMTTVPNTIPVVNYDKTLQANRTLLMPVGSELGNITPFPERTLCDDTSRRFNKANIWDVAFCNRFFGSNNRIVQMNLDPPPCHRYDLPECHPPDVGGANLWIHPLTGTLEPGVAYGTFHMTNSACGCTSWYLPCEAAEAYGFCGQGLKGWSCAGGFAGTGLNGVNTGLPLTEFGQQWAEFGYGEFDPCCAWGAVGGCVDPNTGCDFGCGGGGDTGDGGGDTGDGGGDTE